MRWNGPTWQAKTITVVLHQFHWKETSLELDQEHVIGIQRARTNQRLNMANLRPISVSRVPICDAEEKTNKQTNQADLRLGPRPLAWDE